MTFKINAPIYWLSLGTSIQESIKVIPIGNYFPLRMSTSTRLLSITAFQTVSNRKRLKIEERDSKPLS